MSNCLSICSLFKGAIWKCKNFPLFILSSLFMNLFNLWIKYDKRYNIIKTINLFTLSHQSEIQYLIFLSFNAYWCSKSTFSKSWRRRCIVGGRIVRLVRYIGSYGISPFSIPDRDILSFAQERSIELSKIWSVKCNEVHLNLFFRGVYRLILAIRIIYGWLGSTNKMK